MKIEVVRAIEIADVIVEFRKATLENAEGDVRIYDSANIGLSRVYPASVNPASLYLLRKNLEFQRELREHLYRISRHDTLDLKCILHLKDLESGKVIGLMPPYVEVQEEVVRILKRRGEIISPTRQILGVPILIDGLHRAQLAREEKLPFTAFIVSGMHPGYPYCAYPCEWSEVHVYDSVPPVKRRFRSTKNYVNMRPLDVLRGLTPAASEYGRK